MNIESLISLLRQEESVTVSGKTFEPQTIQEIRLETGEELLWATSFEGVWLTVDESSEEIMIFNELEIEVDMMDDSIVYRGEDYELSFEGEGVLEEDGEEVDHVLFRDYEGSEGEILRAIEFSVNSEIIILSGKIVPEEEVRSL